MFAFKNTNGLIKKGGALNKLPPAVIVFSILLIIVYSFFVFYVYKLHENISDDCECSKSWLRYLLYIQSIFIAISVLSNIFILLF